MKNRQNTVELSNLANYLFFHILRYFIMAQSKINISGLSNKTDADKLAEHTTSVASVKFVNVNHEQGFAVVTHGDDFDPEAFKAAVNELGFNAS